MGISYREMLGAFLTPGPICAGLPDFHGRARGTLTV
jgi:hypothetical protein